MTADIWPLSNDMLTQILIKLPVKSLLRFKTVCKSWCNEITDPGFDLIWRKVNTSFSKYSAALILKIRTSSHAPLEWRYAMELSFPEYITCLLKATSNECFRICGARNGVYLVQDGFGNLVLWNHTTRNFRILSQGDDFESNKCVAYGLMSDEFAEGAGIDFLVMRFYYRENGKRVPELYRLSTGSWKYLKPLPKELNSSWMSETSENLNGVFYWMASRDDSFFSISFDPETETFGKVDFLDILPQGKFPSLLCYNVNGKILLSTMIFRKGKIEVWVMKDVDVVGNSWVKEATIGLRKSNDLEVYVLQITHCLCEASFVSLTWKSR